MQKLPTIFLLVCALMTAAGAADLQLDKVLTDRYHDKVLALRQPFQSNYQEYDADGKPLMVAPVGPWTIYRGVIVKKITIDRDKLRLEAKRVVYIFKKDHLAPFQSDERVRITVESKSPLSSEDDAGRLLDSIFMFDDEDIINSAPSYWRAYLRHPATTKPFAKTERSSDDPSQNRVVDCSPTLPDCGTKVFRLGDPGVTAPKRLFVPDPEFSEYARKLHVEGVVGLNITIDASGQVKDVTIVKPMGAGLDEKAVDTVSRWRLAPATKDGQPVAVAAYVEVDYHLGP